MRGCWEQPVRKAINHNAYNSAAILGAEHPCSLLRKRVYILTVQLTSIYSINLKRRDTDPWG